MHKKSIRQYGVKPAESPLTDVEISNLVMDTLSPRKTKLEATRCLHCDEICNVWRRRLPQPGQLCLYAGAGFMAVVEGCATGDGSITFENDQDLKSRKPSRY
jgi:hypothetical protein